MTLKPSAPVFLSCLAAMACAWLVPAHVGASEAMNSELHALFEAAAEEHRVPALAWHVTVAGEVVAAGGTGGATADTPYVLGSLSKGLTALLVLGLAEAGQLDLDAPVQSMLPEFTLADADHAARVTVRHLLNQASGLPTRTPVADSAAPLADHVALLSTVTPVAAVGERHVYSSANYQVLGLLAEQVTGKSFGDLMAERVFGVLGMAHSHVELAPAAADGLVPGHRYWFGSPRPQPLALEPGRLPTASLVSSAADLGTYMRHLLVDDHGAFEPGAPAKTFQYAAGWRIGPTLDTPSAWHGGALPGYRTALVVLPERKVTIAVLANVGTMLGNPTRRIAKQVVAAVTGEGSVPPERSVPELYFWINVFLAVFALSHLWGWVSLGRWRRKTLARMESGRSAGKSHGRVRLAAPILFGDVVVPVAVLVYVPIAVGITWLQMFDSTPDLVLAMLVLVSTTMVLGAVKIVLLSRTRAD